VKFPKSMFADIAHYFEWCRLVEKQWRARIRTNPKTAKAERSLAEFHASYPAHVVNLAQWRLNNARRRHLEAGRTTVAR
jgi:hypothetical protein